MRRKLVVASILFLSVTVSFVPARAAQQCADLSNTFFGVSTTLKLVLNIPNVTSVTANSVKWNETFTFNGQNDGFVFEDDALDLGAAEGWWTFPSQYPVWTQNGCTFSVDYATFYHNVLIPLLEGKLGITITPVTPAIFTGKVTPSGTLSGNLTLNWSFSGAAGNLGQVSGTLTITASFKGKTLKLTSRPFNSSRLAQGTESESLRNMADMIAGMLSSIRTATPGPQK